MKELNSMLYVLLCISIRSINKLNRCMCIWPEFQSYNVWILLKTVIKYLIDQSAKQYRCYITVRLGCNGIYIHTRLMHMFKLFKDRIDIHNNTHNVKAGLLRYKELQLSKICRGTEIVRMQSPFPTRNKL